MVPHRRTYRGGFAAALLCLALAAAPAAAAATAQASEGAPVAGDAVSALGRIEPEHGIIRVSAPSMVNAVNGAVVRQLLVEAGDDVTEGQLLAVTDTATSEQAQVGLRKAELALAEKESAMALGQEQDICSRSDVAQRTSTRRSNLLKTGVASTEEADIAAGDAKALSGSCTSAKIATQAADLKVAVARAEVDRAQAELDRCYVKAPMGGRVLRILKRPGELMGADGVLEMGHVDRMYAIAEIYETDIGRVKVGQKATVTSSALAAPLSGKVERVRLQVRKQDATGTDPAARKDARIVEVEVLLDDPKPVASLSNLQVDVLIHP
ncbi:MAG TPA: HlyD family efflux transporter periplasmic adaptor subunit [Candidatus Binatia bacterium]|jgi:HlyD family secretion protein